MSKIIRWPKELKKEQQSFREALLGVLANQARVFLFLRPESARMEEGSSK